MITENELEEIYRQDKLVLGETLSWRWLRGAYRLEAPVLLPNGEELTLRGTYRKKYSFILLYRKTQLIRQWDFHHHQQPGGTKIRGPHKHKWTIQYGREWAYPVTDIPTNNVEVALFKFLEECILGLRAIINKY